MLDLHGQPPAPFNAGLRLDRAVHEMLGMVKGILADGVVTEVETFALRSWLSANSDLAGDWPISVLADRLNGIFTDFRVSEVERLDLARLLQRMVGDGYGVAAGANLSTKLPIDDPPPPLTFPGKTYVLTGHFAYAPRRTCEQEIVKLGGTCHATITRKTDVLVLGTFASRLGAHVLRAQDREGCRVSGQGRVYRNRVRGPLGGTASMTERFEPGPGGVAGRHAPASYPSQ